MKRLLAFRIIGIVGIVLGLTFVGTVVEHHAGFRPLKHALQRQTVPSGMLTYGTMGKILRRLDLIQVLPNDEAASPASVNILHTSIRRIQKKSRSGIQVYGFGHVSPEEMPSSTMLPRAALSDPTPILSLVLAEPDLFDPLLGLLTNPEEKGRSWERPAYLSYVDQGKLMFATGVGVRIHGGVCREAEKKSFRVYFRETYGATHMKPGILFDGHADPVTRFVIRSRHETSNIFSNALAYDVSRQIGAIAPHTQVVRFFLNGEFQDVYILTEHIDLDYLRVHFGHDRFLLARSKSPRSPVSGSRKTYREFRAWANARVPLTMEEATRHINLENFSLWILSVLFCSTTDMLQGPVLLDLSDPEARWFWINWDMDHSFIATNLNVKEHAWEEDLFRRFYLVDPRAYLYHRLRLGSQEFREYFCRLFMDVLNHRLSPQFLQERQHYYAELARSFYLDQSEFNEELSRFFTNRKTVLRAQMQTYFVSGDSYPCHVEGPPDIRFEIDGYPEAPGYTGWYFSHTPLTVRLTDTAGRTFSHWLINRQKTVNTPVLTYPITTETTLEPVFF